MRLAVFTDAHLQLARAPWPWELLGKPLTGFLNWQKRKIQHSDAKLRTFIEEMQAAKPDYFLFMGDLVNLGLDFEWANGARVLHNICPPEKLVFLPGNHDFYTHQSVRSMEKHLGKLTYPLIKEDSSTRFIGLSTALVTPPFNATGYLDAFQLETLEGALKTSKRRIIALHHPPVEIEGGLGHKRLINLEAFQAIILKHGAELILHGHTHRTSHYFIGKTPVIGVASASHLERGEWLNVE